MSIPVELAGKGGQLCQLARSGEMICPLRVHPRSEDVILANVVMNLRQIRPHLWLNGILNQALGTHRFRQVWFSNFRMKLWERQARYPQELLSFPEGQTEPDWILEWDNGPGREGRPICIWIEAKWLSPMAKATNGCVDNDQVIRGVRTLLADTGHIRPPRLFATNVRQAVWIGLVRGPQVDPLIQRYRCGQTLADRLAAGPYLCSLPPGPFIGQLTWRELCRSVAVHHRSMTRFERQAADTVRTYLEMKLGSPRDPIR